MRTASMPPNEIAVPVADTLYPIVAEELNIPFRWGRHHSFAPDTTANKSSLPVTSLLETRFTRVAGWESDAIQKLQHALGQQPGCTCIVRG